MYLDTTCVGLPPAKWEALTKGARKASYKRLIRRVKVEIPDLYRELSLQYFNPWERECRQTPTHYILVHSAVEYFIYK